MPVGTVRWFEANTGRGRVRSQGKDFPIVVGETERDARVEGAKVHFDVRREGGTEWAINVFLCRGTRVHRLQHRFGDLVGRRSHGAAGEREPSTLAALWLESVGRGDANAAAALHAPDACLHAGDVEIQGRDHIRGYLDRSPFLGRGVSRSDVRAEDERTVVVRWDEGEGGPSHETRLRAAHGEILDQWL